MDRGFERVEDYVAWMSEPSRVVHVEWRKVRHEKSRGLTSHSWLEVRLLDEQRLRIEIYADRGYTESRFDPREPGENLGFFDPDSTIYDGRVAGIQELARPLTAESLRKEAKALARRHYKLSEFNCHHFVLELWNSMVVTSLQSLHYPDRAKIGLLWGIEEVIGQWFQAGTSLASVGARAAATRPEVFLLETTGPLRLAEMPLKDVKGWVAKHFQGIEEQMTRLTASIADFDEKIFPAASSMWSSMSSISSTAWDLCFVILRGKELRLAVLAVGSQRFFLLSGDALRGEESQWERVVEHHNLSASERAFQLKDHLQQALRRSDWRPPKRFESFSDV